MRPPCGEIAKRRREGRGCREPLEIATFMETSLGRSGFRSSVGSRTLPFGAQASDNRAVAAAIDEGFGFGRRRQGEIYLAGLRGRRPRVPADPVELERRARKAMSRQGFAYVAGGAGGGSAMGADRPPLQR